MKYFISILVTIAVSSDYVVALKFINPVVLIAKEKFGYSWNELKVKCDSKLTFIFPKIEELRDQYDLKSAGVKDEILNEAEKSCPVSDETWNELINEKCFPNQSLISIVQDTIDNIQLCLDTKDRLNEGGAVNAKQELLERSCSMIKTWSKFGYMNRVTCKVL